MPRHRPRTGATEAPNGGFMPNDAVLSASVMDFVEQAGAGDDFAVVGFDDVLRQDGGSA